MDKYTERNVPEQITLRKVNVEYCYQEVIIEIRQKVSEKKSLGGDQYRHDVIRVATTTSADLRTLCFFIQNFVRTKQETL